MLSVDQLALSLLTVHEMPSLSFEILITLIFLKVATTLVDLLFIEHMLHLSHVKQMHSQPIHLAHELIL